MILRAGGRRRVVGSLCAALLLSGCALLGSPPREESPWEHDPASGRYYQPDRVLDSPDLVETHLPDVPGVLTVTGIEGQFTDPGGRGGIPAQDDYWWQLVLEVEPETVASLVDAAADAAPEGAPTEGGTLTEAELREALVPPIEEALADCEEDWVSVQAVVGDPAREDLTAAGDLLGIAAVCPGGDQLVVSARDM